MNLLRRFVKAWRRIFPPIVPFDEKMRLARLYGYRVLIGEMTEAEAREELRRLNVM